jgi:hypothetical protein
MIQTGLGPHTSADSSDDHNIRRGDGPVAKVSEVSKQRTIRNLPEVSSSERPGSALYVPGPRERDQGVCARQLPLDSKLNLIDETKTL